MTVNATKPVGKVRSPLAVILFGIITIGIYSLYWYYRSFKELKQFTGQGVGGGLGLLLTFLLGIITIFLLPAEVGNMYAGEGKDKPVSGKTGFWVFLPIVGGIVWIVKVQGAMNRNWQAHGAIG